MLGGKGSGKTHLMRYCSFAVQKLRTQNDVLNGLRNDGYIGIFSRANTIDTGRFQGKGQDEESWGVLFNYYFEIHMCEQLLSILVELSQHSQELSLSLDTVAQCANDLFDDENRYQFESIVSFYEAVVSIRKKIDLTVNNCAFTKKLDITVFVTPGNLLFGIPELISNHVVELAGVQFLYLIDEVENFSTEKQRFLNTLIRHRRGPCSFRIGARLYGIKTQKNYGSDEENKEGSEYKSIHLDHAMRAHKGTGGYESFAKRLCAKRLLDAEIIDSVSDENTIAKRLDSFFETLTSENFYQKASLNIVKSSGESERNYFSRLRSQLHQDASGARMQGISNETDVDSVISDLTCIDYPLLEKVNIFMFYQEWYQGKNLKEASTSIKKGCSALLSKKAGAERHKRVYSHFSLDLLAQLYRDYSQQPTAMYSGLNSFIRMSAGVPRNLLIILHNMYKWACFNGEKPFTETPISIESQREAILESSTFYYEEDARPGVEIPNVREVIARLAEYLREVRFSSKPVEPSPLSLQCQ